jgi:hypothetical protein
MCNSTNLLISTELETGQGSGPERTYVFFWTPNDCLIYSSYRALFIILILYYSIIADAPLRLLKSRDSVSPPDHVSVESLRM